MVAKLICLFWVSVLCAGFSTAASATARVWTLSELTFVDGGTAAGSFVYDADTHQFSAVNLTTTTGSLLPGATFHYVCKAPCMAGTWADSEVVFLSADATTDLTGAHVLALSFEPTLDNSGTSATVRGGEGACIDATCSGIDGFTGRGVLAGSAWSPLLDEIFANGFDP